MSSSTYKTELRMIPWARPELYGNEQRYVAEAVSSSWISGGPFVDRFERHVRETIGAKHSVATSNGTTALHVAFLAMGLQPGDEIVMPGFAFLAAANVALHMGVTPVFTEVDPQTWGMRAEDAAPHITKRTRLIVPVHTYGNVCDMDEILALGKEKKVPILEDAAESFGSFYKGRPAGTMGAAGTYSYHASKTITTGEGGAVVTDSAELADRMRLIGSHGVRVRRYFHEVAGHNFRLTNMQAAFGCAQFEHYAEIRERRRRMFDTYMEFFSAIDGICPQVYNADVDAVVWAIAVKLDPKAFPQGRDAVMQSLRELGIETRNGFFAASEQTHLYKSGPLPICESLSAHVISLPSFPSLEREDIKFICDSLRGLRR